MNRNISGLSKIKTSLNTLGRSKTKTSKENLFLDMFAMKMKKNRLMHERGIYEKKLKGLDADLRTINNEIAKVQDMICRETPMKK
ncbi:MAG: hypothetical protein HY880_00085 [Deltaproteobacteria bacterium]|nr:hypothetical protein [Deltaproteobacteria bacterium]